MPNNRYHTLRLARTVLLILALVAIVLAISAPVSADAPVDSLDLLENSCVHCHDGEFAEGGLDLAGLSTDLSDPNVAATWVRIHDRVESGEMPPPDDEELDLAQKDSFVAETSRWIKNHQLQEFSKAGRVQGRRLTNAQLERTLQDLLGIDAPVARLMPAEPRTNGYIGIADAQSMSHFHLESHLEVVDAALDVAMDRLFESPEPWSRTFTPKELCRRRPGQRNREPELRKGLAIVWASNMVFYGRITPTAVDDSGWYEIKVTASAIKKPEDKGVWCTVRSGQCVSSAPQFHWIDSFEATSDPVERTFLAWIDETDKLEIRPGDNTIKKARFRGGQVGAGEGEPQDVPGVAMHSLSMKRVYPFGDRQDVAEKLFGDLEIKVDRRKRTIKLVSKDPIAQANKQLRTFVRRAFKRKPSESSLKPYQSMLTDAIDQGRDPVDALLATYRAVLCSPRFVYFVEPAATKDNQTLTSKPVTSAPASSNKKSTRKISTRSNTSSAERTQLDQYALASRLSYMLTGSLPDWKLYTLARDGKLASPRSLHSQVDRLLSGGRTEQFVKDFTGQWLDLLDIDFTEPDTRTYRDYDPVVQNAMLAETHQYLVSMLKRDASVTELVKSNHTFVNSRLARYYDLDGVSGEQVQRVELPEDSVRGGLLSQGAILKVTANGTNTSPVLRGVWASERILGTEIPPPPENVPAVEPDIRGAKTIREQLQKHVADQACASCHQNIDPPGYALENFDPAGQWRDRYLDSRGRKSKKGAIIDASFVMSDGTPFKDFNEFRELVCNDPQKLAENFVSQLLTYGTGAEPAFADREVIKQIASSTKQNNYGLLSLVKATVSSPIFLSK